MYKTVLFAEEQDLTRDVSTLHYQTLIPLLFLLTSFFFIGIFSSGSHSVICHFIFIMLSAHLTAHFS